MSSRTSQSALKQLVKTTVLANSIRTQKPIVNARLGALPPLTPSDDPETDPVPSAPDWDHLQTWGIASLDASAQEIRQADHTLRQVLVQADSLRGDRKKLRADLSSNYRAVRRSFTGVYGDEALPLVGLDAEPARGFLAIGEQVSELITRMRDPEMVASLPTPRAGQSPPDLESLTAVWETQIQGFDNLTQEIDRLLNISQELRVLLREARQRSQRIYSNVGRLQEGLYRLAGLGDLADRMRATLRAARKKQSGEATDEPTDADETSGESGGDDSSAPLESDPTVAIVAEEQPSEERGLIADLS